MVLSQGGVPLRALVLGEGSIGVPDVWLNPARYVYILRWGFLLLFVPSICKPDLQPGAGV